MAYASHSDIESEFKELTLSSTTTVKDSEVDAFCDQASATIDGIIQNRYEVPVTGPFSLLILKYITILLVKARVLSILSVKSPQDKTKQDPDGPTLLKQAMDLLTQIKKGQLVLTDAPAAAGFTGGMTSYLIDQDVTPDFAVDEETW